MPGGRRGERGDAAHSHLPARHPPSGVHRPAGGRFLAPEAAAADRPIGVGRLISRMASRPLAAARCGELAVRAGGVIGTADKARCIRSATMKCLLARSSATIASAVERSISRSPVAPARIKDTRRSLRAIVAFTPPEPRTTEPVHSRQMWRYTCPSIFAFGSHNPRWAETINGA